MPKDRIELFGNSVIQHGKFNDRIYLMKYSGDDFPGLLDRMDELVKTYDYSKVFAKVPAEVMPAFRLRGFEVEAYIPSYFKNGSDAVFASKFVQPARKQIEIPAMEQMLASLAENKPLTDHESLENGFTFRELGSMEAVELSNLYRVVFKSYPFPIHDPDYLAGTMKDNFRYFGIFDRDENLVAASSSEMDAGNLAVEMTDFAVHPEARGNGLALSLLHEMEKSMTVEGMKTFFTIARLNSPAMNITFLRNNYRYSGTLIRNTNISGRIESMNVLYKKSGEK